MNLKHSIENHIVIWLLSTLLTGFIAGISTYKGILEIAQLDTIQKNTYIMKEDLHKCYVTKEKCDQDTKELKLQIMNKKKEIILLNNELKSYLKNKDQLSTSVITHEDIIRKKIEKEYVKKNISENKRRLIKIFGIITDSKGNPLMGASISMPGIPTEYTDIDGYFSVDIEEIKIKQASLTIFKSGFKRVIKQVPDSQENIKIALEEENENVQ